MSHPSSGRRGSIDVLRRLSVELAVNIGVFDEGDLGQLAQVAPDEEEAEEGKEEEPEGDPLEIIHNPVSLLHHTVRSNVDGVVCALPAAGMIILAYNLVRLVVSQGGVWGDRHAAFCALCMVLVETLFGFANRFERVYVLRRLLIGFPVQILGNVLVSCFVFGWRPGGVWVPVITTTVFWISFVATYPLLPANERTSFPKYVKTTFVIAFGSHGGIVAYIYALVLPTRLLAKSDNDILTLLVTGVVFPGCALLTRKVLVIVIQKHITANLTGMSREDKMVMLSNWLKGSSSFIMFLPTVLLYLNTTPRLALLSAMAQLVTETAGKVWILWAERAVTRAAVQSGGLTSEMIEKKRNHNLAMLALRWHSDIVAEKGSIINAAIVAFLYLGVLVDASTGQLALVGVLYFGMEAISDWIFVKVMVTYCGVPMLSAIPYDDVLSKDNLAGATIMALGFTSMSVCIGMAASVPL
jgi:hypothetical protein